MLLLHTSLISEALGFPFIFFGGATESMRIQLLLLPFFFNFRYCNFIFQTRKWMQDYHNKWHNTSMGGWGWTVLFSIFYSLTNTHNHYHYHQQQINEGIDS
jgi:hypothetical protein